MDVLTEHGLVTEVADGTFSFKNKISAASVKLLWDKLSRFILDALKQQKGVLVPNLGTFAVGPVVGEARKKVRPAFTLLETRYAGVSQERPKHAIGGRCPVVQPNYGVLAAAAAVHRGACQRLVLELMQRLGVHILSGRAISVAFPGVGRLFTNKAGRIQFDFDPLLREFFELERERIIPEMEVHREDDQQSDEARVGQVVRGLQQVHLHNPPAIRSRPTTGASAGTPTSPSAKAKRNAHAPYKGGLLDLWRLCKSNDRINSGCVPRLQLEQWLHKECAQVLRQVAAATVLELLSTNTYGKTGKHILYKPFLDKLEAAIGDVSPLENAPQTVQSPRRIVEVRVDSPGSGTQWQQQGQASGGEREAVEVTFSPATDGRHPSQQQGQHPFQLQNPPRDQYAQQGQYTPHGQYGQYTPQAQYAQQGQYALQGYYQPQGQYAPSQGQYAQSPQGQPTQQERYQGTSLGQYPPQRLFTPQGQYAQQPQYAASGQYTPQAPYAVQQGQQQQQQQQAYTAPPTAPVATPSSYGPPSHDRRPDPHRHNHAARPPPAALVLPQTPASAGPDWQGRSQGGDASGSEGSVPLHYFQNQLSPRSRREFDNFNRLHFKELEQARGHNYKNRAVTPKVGEDELNRREYHAIRQGGDTVSPAQVLGLQDDPPYSREKPQPIVSTTRQRGSPGPRPQIMTLGHESPSPPRPVPGLPNHFYQHQSQPQSHHHHQHQHRQPTPVLQRPLSARQPTPAPKDDSPPPISQYDIINEPDPVQRQRLRNELANALQREWSEQIREKQQVLEEIKGSQTAWPYTPTHLPNDKRPVSAVSRPPSAALRGP